MIASLQIVPCGVKMIRDYCQYFRKIFKCLSSSFLQTKFLSFIILLVAVDGLFYFDIHEFYSFS